MRLRRLESELGDRVQMEWHSFLLRPYPDPNRTLERFRAYTESWCRPAADVDGGTFRVWSTDAGPPTHSIPPHLVAKAAMALGRPSFAAVHEALLHAHFAENRDITDDATLRRIWAACGLPAAAFDRVNDAAILDEVLAQHNEAVQRGVTGVPAVGEADGEFFLVGAQPLDTYRHWIGRLLQRRAQASP